MAKSVYSVLTSTTNLLARMRLYILTFSMICLAFCLPAQTVSDKLEAYFSFDNCKGTDDSGNGSIAALKGNIACDCGILDSAMRFADLNDSINVAGPFADIFTTSDFTISFYIRPPDGQNQVNSQLIMAKQDTCSLANAFWVRYVPKYNRLSSGISENDSVLATVTAELDDNPCWQFITLTRSNTVYSLYVNGKWRDSKTSAARIDLKNNALLQIGGKVCPLDNPYIGMFDELRFFSKALSEKDIAKYYYRADQILNRDTLVYLGNSFQVSLSEFCADDFTWSPTDGVSDPTIKNPVITPTDSTYYSVQIEYADGCLAIDSIYVKVIDPKTLDCELVFIPNAFTPNGTPNLNDKFGISNPFAINEFISFEIFDRWGGRVFNAETPFDAWDGTSNGEPVNPGVYLYRLRYKCNGGERVKNGSLTLLR
ncbi:MAG: gliding motility-associated C-terminal domain-containing protein [Saprospiraceae bacterium]|nr:gliding motility-associated C-terminal domain-containing protein [Saprospiraceae bacterium]